MAKIVSTIEGPIETVRVSQDPTGAGVDIIAMNVTIRFLPSPRFTNTGRTRRIRTPSQELTIQQLLDTAPLPGRTQAGFEGGTIIAEGSFDTDTNILLADFVDVEPGESVLIGAVTNLPTSDPPLRINGTPVRVLTDPRLSSNPTDPGTPLYQNQYGFSITIGSIPPGPPPDPSAAEGYFANGEFHAFSFEYGGTGTFVTPPNQTPQISIERAGYRDDGAKYRIEVRGHVTSHHANNLPPKVVVQRIDADPNTGLDLQPKDFAAGVDVNRVDNNIWRWELKHEFNKSPAPHDLIPQKIRAYVAFSGVEYDAVEDNPDVREP